MDEDADVTVRLPLSAWRVVLSLTEAGPYRVVAGMIESMCTQINQHVIARNQAELAAQIAQVAAQQTSQESAPERSDDVPAAVPAVDNKSALH